MNEPRRVALLGATGSIGTQTLDVLRAHPKRFELVAAIANSDEQKLSAIATEFDVAFSGLGSEAAIEAAARADVDVVLNAIVGAAGLAASVAALSAGKTLALANKESLVAGGELCVRAAERNGGVIVPVDSEHSAIAQCLRGRERREIRKIVLTASGGPFRTRADLQGVTPDEALAHPTWNMGPKVTIDSATMMNKGLEVIEAHFLFGFDYDDIDVVIHPQSTVHGMVDMKDGSTIMASAVADMRIPIAAALSHPGPSVWNAAPGDKSTTLEFQPADHDRWPALRLAYKTGRIGGTAPAVLNAANEIAVRAFLDGALDFADITSVVERVVDAHEPRFAFRLQTIHEVDEWARAEATALIAGSQRMVTQ